MANISTMMKKELKDFIDYLPQKNSIIYVPKLKKKTIKIMYKIIDWAGNRMFPNKTFKSFQKAWDHIYENVDNSVFNETGKLGDDCYQEYYVVLND